MSREPLTVEHCTCGRVPRIVTGVRGFRLACPDRKRCRARGIQRRRLRDAIRYWNRDVREVRACFAVADTGRTPFAELPV